MNTNTLQKKIMRRIYYAYTVQTLTNPILLLGFFMLGLMIVLTYFVSIGNVLMNMTEVGVGRFGNYFYNAVTNTEAWTLLIIGLLIFSAFSIRIRIKASHRVPKFAR